MNGSVGPYLSIVKVRLKLGMGPVSGTSYIGKKYAGVMSLSQNVAFLKVNKYVKFDENSFNSMDAMTMSVFFKVLKGRYFYQSTIQSYVLWSECSPCDGEQVCEV